MIIIKIRGKQSVKIIRSIALALAICGMVNVGCAELVNTTITLDKVVDGPAPNPPAVKRVNVLLGFYTVDQNKVRNKGAHTAALQTALAGYDINDALTEAEVPVRIGNFKYRLKDGLFYWRAGGKIIIGTKNSSNDQTDFRFYITNQPVR